MANALANMIVRVPKMAYSPEEAGEALSVSRQEVHGLINRGLLRAYKHGKLTRIPHKELEQFISTMLSEHPAHPTVGGAS